MFLIPACMCLVNQVLPKLGKFKLYWIKLEWSVCLPGFSNNLVLVIT